jgi:hypothetical protein
MKDDCVSVWVTEGGEMERQGDPSRSNALHGAKGMRRWLRTRSWLSTARIQA